MRDVKVRARHLRQDHIAGDHRLFRCRRDAGQAEERGVEAFVHDAAIGEVRILLVRDDRHPQHRAVFQRAPHELRIGDRLAVIADRDASRRSQIRELRQLLAFQTFADGTDGIHATRAVPRRLGDDHLGDRPLVVRRNRVRHRAHRRVPARHCRPSSGRDRLFMFLAGLAQMGVQIDETGHDHQTAGIDGFGGRLQLLADFADRIVGDQDISFGVEPLTRIDDAPASDQQVHERLECRTQNAERRT